MTYKKIIYALCTLSGTIIGVGLFSLPYITSQVGIWTMLIYFFLLGSLTVIVHLLFGEVALKTPDFLRMPGFVRIHLGKLAEKISFISIIFGLFGANLAYLIIGGKFLNNLLNINNELIGVFVYFAIGAVLVYSGIKAISKVEFWGLILFFTILVVIFINGLPSFRMENLISSCARKDLFLPYGPILFALWGAALIPEVEEMLGKDKRLFKKIIFVALLIPIITYLAFIFLVTGISGTSTSEESIVGLSKFLNNKIIILALLFGLLTTFTSFISIGLTLKKVLNYDLKIKKNLSWLITCFVPIILFLLGFQNFIKVISFVGGITIGVDGILIILMYQKIKKGKKIAFLAAPLVSVFILGIVYQIIYFIK